MVSFSCDACQNVFTKPRIERHFYNCRTHSVSCIDCGVEFDSLSVRGHTSCVTEAEKHGPKTGKACTQTFCGICKLPLNGAVHALQHYDSKKHRAAERKAKAVEKDNKKDMKEATEEKQDGAPGSKALYDSATTDITAKFTELPPGKEREENSTKRTKGQEGNEEDFEEVSETENAEGRPGLGSHKAAWKACTFGYWFNYR